MLKPKLFMFFIVLLMICPSGFALDQEEITLTTYYPAPHGNYSTLQAESFETDRIGVGSGISAPTDNGVIRLEPRDTAPAEEVPGNIYYQNNGASPGEVKFYDGVQWMNFVPAAFRVVDSGVLNMGTSVGAPGQTLELGNDWDLILFHGYITGVAYKNPAGSPLKYHISLTDVQYASTTVEADAPRLSDASAFDDGVGGTNPFMVSVTYPNKYNIVKIREATDHDDELQINFMTGTHSIVCEGYVKLKFS